MAAVLLVLVVGGVVASKLVDSGNVTATDVKVGDCLAEIPEGAAVLSVRTIACDELHAGEVFAVLVLPDGDFPGQAVIEAYHEQCAPRLSEYSPDSMTDDSVQLYVLYPSAETWEGGDRSVSCIATLEPPRTGSIKG